MAFEPIRRDTPTNTLIAAMEHCDGAADCIVILVKDRDETHESHVLFTNEYMSVATAAWLLDSMKLRLHESVRDKP